MEDHEGPYDPYFANVSSKPRHIHTISGKGEAPGSREEASSDDQWRPQTIRLKKLWHVARKELENSQQEIERLKDRLQKLGSHQRYLEVKEREVVTLSQRNAQLLRERERFDGIIEALEQDKIILHKENESLVERVGDLNAEIANMESTQAAQSRNHQIHHEELLTVKKQLTQAESKSEHLATELEKHGHTIVELEQELETKKRWLKAREKECQESEYERDIQFLALKQKFVNLDIEHQTLSGQMDERREELARVKSERDSLLYIKAEVAQFKRDSQRLLALLCQTKEYQTFECFQNSVAVDPPTDYSYLDPTEMLVHQDPAALREWGSEVKRLQKSHPPIFFNSSEERHILESDESFDAMLQKTQKVVLKSEKSHWIPHDILLLCHQSPYHEYLRVHENPLFYGLVYEMNVLWRKVGHIQHQKLEAKYRNEITALQRRVRNAKPYAEVVSQEELKRLKRQLLEQARVKASPLQTRKGKSVKQQLLVQFDRQQRQMNALMSEWVEQETAQQRMRARES